MGSRDLMAALHRVLGYMPDADPEHPRVIELDIEPGGDSVQEYDPHGHEADHEADRAANRREW